MKDATIRIEHGKGPRFAQMPWQLQDADWVTAYTLAVYAALRRYTDFNGTTGARPSLRTLAAKAHLSRTKLRQELIRLKKHGWVDWVSGGPTTTNRYTVNTIPTIDSPSSEVGGSPQDLGPITPQSGSPQDPGWVAPGPRVGPNRTPTESHIPEPLPEPSTKVKTLAASQPVEDAEAIKKTREKIKVYPEAFELTWAIYPKREGGNSKKSAFTAWNARINAGVAPEEIHAGVERYVVYLKAVDRIGTRYVKQAQTFFGPGDHFREPWTPPRVDPRYDKSLFASDRPVKERG